MTHEKVIQVMGMYAERFDKGPCISEAAEAKICEMIPKMREIAADPTRSEKLMRWLGFAQGVLWAEGYYTLEELKRHNQP